MIKEKYSPLVSIITPVKNGSEYLDPLVNSVINQNYPNIEHIIIDDGSNDNGQTIQILKKYPGVNWSTRENRGQYKTMNEGLELAKGEIVCFISADDFLQIDSIQTVIDYFKIHPEKDAVYGLTDYISENNEKLSIKQFVRYANLRYYPFFAHVSHSSLYVKKEALLSKSLFFNPSINLVGDFDWILRLFKANIKIGFVDKYLSTIRVHSNQLSSINRTQMAINQKRVATTHGYGGFQYFFFINLLHLINLSEQIVFAYRNGKLKGVIKYLKNWLKNRYKPKILAFLRRDKTDQ